MSEYDAIDAMARYGGSFVKALAACYQLADEQNRARLSAAFSDVFKEYRRLAAEAKTYATQKEIANG